MLYFPQGNDSWTIIEFLEHEFASQEWKMFSSYMEILVYVSFESNVGNGLKNAENISSILLVFGGGTNLG